MEYYKGYSNVIVQINEIPNSEGKNLFRFSDSIDDGWLLAVPDFYPTIRQVYTVSTLEEFLKYKTRGL